MARFREKPMLVMLLLLVALLALGLSLYLTYGRRPSPIESTAPSANPPQAGQREETLVL